MFPSPIHIYIFFSPLLIVTPPSLSSSLFSWENYMSLNLGLNLHIYLRAPNVPLNLSHPPLLNPSLPLLSFAASLSSQYMFTMFFYLVSFFTAQLNPLPSLCFFSIIRFFSHSFRFFLLFYSISSLSSVIFFLSSPPCKFFLSFLSSGRS